MQKSVKIDAETYEKMQEVKKLSGIPLTKLVEYAWGVFERSEESKAMLRFRQIWNEMSKF